MRVLVVAPHPDDEVLGSGGTIARHVGEGDTVDVVVVTRGDDSYDQAWIDQSHLEAAEAHKILGVGTTFWLDFPSPILDTVPFREIVDAIPSGYDIMYIPWRGDVHQEHRIVHDACMVAARPPGPDIFAYETLTSTEWGTGFHPNHFVALTEEQYSKKLKAFAEYRTQIQERPSPRSLLGIAAQARARGFTVNADAAEAFVTMRTVR